MKLDGKYYAKVLFGLNRTMDGQVIHLCIIRHKLSDKLSGKNPASKLSIILWCIVGDWKIQFKILYLSLEGNFKMLQANVQIDFIYTRIKKKTKA